MVVKSRLILYFVCILYFINKIIVGHSHILIVAYIQEDLSLLVEGRGVKSILFSCNN